MLYQLHQAYLSPEDMADLLTAVSIDRSVVRTWINAIDNVRVHGVRKLIEERTPTASDLSLEESDPDDYDQDSDREPWLIPAIRDAFKAVVREQFVAKMNEMDPLTRIGAMSFDDDTEFADDWESLSSTALTSWAYTKGNNANLRGGVKRGKTNFALLLAELFLAEGWIVVGNIKVQNPPKDYHYASTLSDMLRFICKARLENKKVLIILDEGGIFWAKIDTIQKQHKALAKMILTYGKLDSNLLAIHHWEADIPTALARTAVADFEKTGVKNVFVSIKDGIKVRPRLFTSVPPTKLSYRPEEIQMFTINLPVDRLFDMISRLPDGKNQWEEMLKIIDELELGKVDDIDEKDVAIWLRQKRGFSEHKIAETVATPRGTVHDWVVKAKQDAEPNNVEE